MDIWKATSLLLHIFWPALLFLIMTSRPKLTRAEINELAEDQEKLQEYISDYGWYGQFTIKFILMFCSVVLLTAILVVADRSNIFT